MASKNYDPVKAHEYYMKHRKLKGRKKASTKKKSSKKKSSKAKTPTYKSRTSTEGLNAAGLDAARQAQAEMNVKKSELTTKLNTEMKARIEEVKKSLAGATEEEKKIAAEKLRLEYQEKKTAAANELKEAYASKMDEIKANEDYKS